MLNVGVIDMLKMVKGGIIGRLVCSVVCGVCDEICVVILGVIEDWLLKLMSSILGGYIKMVIVLKKVSLEFDKVLLKLKDFKSSVF